MLTFLIDFLEVKVYLVYCGRLYYSKKVVYKHDQELIKTRKGKLSSLRCTNPTNISNCEPTSRLIHAQSWRIVYPESSWKTTHGDFPRNAWRVLEGLPVALRRKRVDWPEKYWKMLQGFSKESWKLTKNCSETAKRLHGENPKSPRRILKNHTRNY